jgi:glycosyltransferase involved in cell wall biosynthesis
MTHRRPRILLAHISQRHLPSFVLRDLRILQEEFDVTPLSFRGRRDVLRLFAKVATHDAIVSWFAWDQAYWGSFAAGLFGRPSLIIAGGFDVVRMPEIDYGNLISEANAKRTRAALLRGDRVLAVSRSIAQDAATLSGRRDIQVVYLGFDGGDFPFGPNKKRLVLTVGEVTSSNVRRKGIGTFIRTASLLPNVPFVVVGGIQEEALVSLGNLPPNLQLMGRVPDNDLVKLMMDAHVYAQISAHEGFGCSLAEAMLCGCFPVVTHRGAIREVVGDTGHYVPYDDPEKTAEAIREALSSSPAAGRRARARIVELFPIETRRRALLTAVRECLTHSPI